MKTKQKQHPWKTIAGLTGITLIIVLGLIMPNSGIFQGDLQQSTGLHNAAANCQKLNIIALPKSPLPDNTPSVLAITTTPENFVGTFTYEASSGNLNDEHGQIGSYIKTAGKKVSYSGGEDGTTITIQANGEGNNNCLATIPVVKTSSVACTSLKIVSTPDPLTENQSATFTVLAEPRDFQGTYLFQAESGEFQMQDADVQANGNHTKTLVTKSTNVLYNGGKSGEKIVVKALGSNNTNCVATIPITQ